MHSNKENRSTFASVEEFYILSYKPHKMSTMKPNPSVEEISHEGRRISLLNLPERIMDCILRLLSPIELCRMSEACTFLRERCKSDHLWEQLILKKWARVFGDAAFKEWQFHVTTSKKSDQNLLKNKDNIQNGSLGSFSGVWPNLCLGSFLQDSRILISGSSSSNKMMMALYFSLENGRFWFPAQIGGVSVFYYHALLRYDSKTDTFQARDRHHAWRFQGENVDWDIVRVPPVETLPYSLHISDCLDSLRPGDHIEIQWRANREAPYDWFYGVIAHLECCDENGNCCRCCYSDTLVVEFKQYPVRFHKRRLVVSKKVCEEQGDDRVVGFYGGIRKLLSEQDIQKWKKHYENRPQTSSGGIICHFGHPPPRRIIMQ